MTGKCHDCVHVRIIKSGKGSRFLLCELSKVDGRFPKYPQQPVIHCAGFEAAPKDGSGQ